MRPIEGPLQYPGYTPMTPAPSSYYQQAPTPVTRTPSTATPGYTSTEQSTRRAVRDSGGLTTTATTGRDTSKPTEETEYERTSYGPWLPAFMCTLILLLVVFLVPYIFLNVGGQGTPHPAGQVGRTTTAKRQGDKTKELSETTAFTSGPYRPPGQYGGLCDESFPCLGVGNCVRGICHCDMPGTLVVKGTCMLAPSTISSGTTRRATTQRKASTTGVSPTTPEPRTPRPPKSTVRIRTSSSLLPSIRFTRVFTVRVHTRGKNRSLAMTTGLAPKMQPGGNSAEPTKLLLRSKTKKLEKFISSRIAPNSTRGTKLHAR